MNYNGVTEEYFKKELLTVEPSLTLPLLKKYSKLSAKREESVVQWATVVWQEHFEPALITVEPSLALSLLNKNTASSQQRERSL